MSDADIKIRCRDASGTITFDSSAEHTLFFRDEQYIAGASVGAGLTFSYPDLAGKTISATLVSPFNPQIHDPDQLAVQSCRVTYPGGVPTVSVFFDNTASTLTRAHGYLLVHFCGT